MGSKKYCCDCGKMVETVSHHCVECGGYNLLDMEGTVSVIFDRLSKIEKSTEMLRADLIDTNEFDKGYKCSYNPIDVKESITVSKSNYEKLKSLNCGDTISVFCADDKTKCLVLRLKDIWKDVACLDYSEPEAAKTATTNKPKRKRRSKKRQKNKSNRQTKGKVLDDGCENSGETQDQTEFKKRYHSRRDYESSYV